MQYGTLKWVGSRFGFIDSPEVKADCGQDVFVPTAALQGIEIGDQLSFDLSFNAKGQPQAGNVRAAGGRRDEGLGDGGGRKRKWDAQW
mmetsp:Transcript_140845/g.351142  ORF Transcript_140845/g.351142 Transcript_140845/m.351142 type:complete len:88 (+) Transcript_140845:3222-3485(+)